MNLYVVTIKSDIIGRETYWVPAGSAKGAIDKAYKKHDKSVKGMGEKDSIVTLVELQNENF